MTLRPAYQDVRGVKGDPYKVGPRCCNPTCRKIAEHAHHMWPRSYLRRQPQNWVELPDGTIIGNLVALCADCHDKVTGRLGGHKAKIAVTPENIFWWCTPASPDAIFDWEWVAPIDPQPPTQASQVASPADPGLGSDHCPTCGQSRRRRSSSPAGKRRRRKNWNVPVPDDAEENGAEVLDTLVAEVGALLDRDSDAGGRYYILLPALYFVLQEPKRFIQNVIGAGA